MKKILLLLAFSAGAFSQPTIINSTKGAGANTFTTPTPISTVGATFIAVCVSQNTGLVAVMSDSQGNSYTALTAHVENGSVQMFYKFSPSTSATHTWTLTGASIFAAVTAVAVSGVGAFESETGASNGGSTNNVSYGSLTPAATNGLMLACVHYEQPTGSTTINAPLTLLQDSAYNGGVSYGGAMAYYFPTSTSAITGQWSSTGGTGQMANSSALFTAGAPTAIRRRVSVIQ